MLGLKAYTTMPGFEFSLFLLTYFIYIYIYIYIERERERETAQYLNALVSFTEVQGSSPYEVKSSFKQPQGISQREQAPSLELKLRNK